MRRRTLRDDNVSIGGNDSHPVRIQQLPISLSHLEVDFFLNQFVETKVTSPNWNLKLPSLSKTWMRWLLVSATTISLSGVTATPLGSVNELPSQDAKLAKLAVVDHLLPLDVCLGGIDYGRRWNWCSNAREIVRGAGGEAMQEQVAHAQQVKGARHVVVLQVVHIVEAQCLVKTSTLNVAG